MTDYDENRAVRDFNMNPPSGAPGLSDEGWDNIFNDDKGSSGTDFSGGNLDVGSILNGGNEGNNQVPGVIGVEGNTPQNVNTENQKSNFSVMIDELAVAGCKGFIAYAKALANSLKNNTSSDWHILGERICKISVGVFILFLLISFLGVFASSIRTPWELFVGSLLSVIAGLLLVFLCRKEPTAENTEPDIQDTIEEPMEEDSLSDDLFNDDEESDWGETEESEWGDEESDWGDAFEDSSLSDFGDIDDSSFASNDDFNAEDEVNKLSDIPQGQYTRQYLFETFSKVLPTIDPSFMSMEDIMDGSDEFMMYEDFMRRSAEQTGVNYDKLDELQLLEVRKNLFIIQLIATRPTGLKEKDIADGIADCYKRDDYGMVIPGREGVFGRVNSQVGKLIIEIFLCNNVMVSLGDIYRQKADFILDSNVVMPLVWGVSEMGSVFCYDGMKDGNGGILISGEARSGKSWKGQSLIAQMCMFMSPKELELYFYDVKGEASDYAYLSKVLPHCKGFCGESLKFNDSIETLLEREKNRRTALLGGKYTNVKDYNKDHPYEKIPTIYIVIDEMATAMSEMKDKDNDIRKKFDSLLIQISTKYPYLEIKLMLFPHRIVNDIINKTVSSMISTRSVMGNVPFEELKTALDVKKDFPYSLVKTGDMAIKTKSLNNGNVVYSHSEVLSTNEQTNRKIFDYIGAVWKKLEPECLSTVSFSRAREDKVAKDNSLSDNDFSYKPSYSSTDTLDELSDSNIDESFWDDVMSDEKENIEVSDDDFWNDWK